jgi:hypothetical protein
LELIGRVYAWFQECGIDGRKIFLVIEGSFEVKLRQYGQMEKQRWEESENRRAEERRS